MTTRATYRARRRANARRAAENARLRKIRLCVRLKANMRAYMHKHQVEWFLRGLESGRAQRLAGWGDVAVYDMGDVIYDDKAGVLPLGPRAKWSWQKDVQAWGTTQKPPPPQSFWDALNRLTAVLNRANHDHELPGEYDLVPKPKDS